ncbi:MFS transporter [Agaribacter marinus]|uniref:MFS transporter n=1 Tax=Agaribacter marinus TaxID=1431249 RepID=A0AA37SYG0_9ALTE|nr:MFS transporter [Agaribacter marinus]GLR70196.1 MFS transporter [Agaribacter marinus]
MRVLSAKQYLNDGSAMLWATRAFFLMAGAAAAFWAVAILSIKSKFALDERQVGLLLLTLGVGAMVAMPLSGRLVQNVGCRRVLTTSCILMVISLTLTLMSQNQIQLFVLACLFGMSIGATDCVMNMHAIIVERKLGTKVMSGFHGCYSAGGIVGSACLVSLMFVGFPLIFIVLGFAVISIFVCYLVSYSIQNEDGVLRKKAWRMPTSYLLLIGSVCFLLFLVEGTVLDWSAIFLQEYLDFPVKLAGIGFAAFSVSMTIMRFSGDRLIERLGERAMVVAGTILAIVSVFMITAFDKPIGVIAGYALLGIGCANIVPIMFSAIAKQRVIETAQAVPIVSSVAYFGVLAGPAFIGELSHQTSLLTAFKCLMLLLFMALLCAVCVFRRQNG